MSGIALKIDIRDGATPAINTIVNSMTGPGRQLMHERIANEERILITNYINEVVAQRHDTAERLGASPSGFWEGFGNNVITSADESRATISLNHPGIGRAGHDVTITPGPGKKFLTIPVIAEAYNQRAYRVPGLVAITNGDKGVLIMPEKGSKFGTVWYLLVASVTQRQDRTLLPDDDELLGAARLAIANHFTELLKEAA